MPKIIMYILCACRGLAGGFSDLVKLGGPFLGKFCNLSGLGLLERQNCNLPVSFVALGGRDGGGWVARVTNAEIGTPNMIHIKVFRSLGKLSEQLMLKNCFKRHC